MDAKGRRQQLIRRIVESRPMHSQEELAAQLAAQGVSATQATLSRDLRELGMLKGPEGYTMAAAPPAQAFRADPAQLRSAARANLLSAQRAGSVVVLRTNPGYASALALLLDQSPPDGVVGTVAGDDTIFVATPSPNKAGRIVKLMRGMLSAQEAAVGV